MADNRHRCTPECGCAPRSDCSALIDKLRKIDFALYDTALYLDVYPECERAQEYYHKLKREREELCRLINTNCGPVTVNDVLPGRWNWTKGPWPWELDANR